MLTDEQMRKIWDEHGPQDMALQEAYRLGMLRAAEVCEELDAFSYDDPGGSAADAIRAEANATTQQRS